MASKFLLFSSLSVITLVSCSENKATEEPIQTYNKLVIETTATRKATPDSVILKSLLQPQVSPGSLTGLPENTTQNSSTAGNVNNSARLNPAHGQPGHRCDIAVGAPLDSKPLPINTATQIQPPVITTQATPVTTATPVTQVVAAGMNPPHGQPKHRCDIAVGAPLNSKPTPKNPNPTILTTQSSAATGTPASVQKVAAGMNPAHGQPNHRCDIAVGAPLNSKPTAPAPNPISPETAKEDSTKQ